MSIYSIILLAAGSSGRMGRPKQLLPYKDNTLLQHLLDQAKGSKANNIIVVLGAFEQEVKSSMNADGIHIVVNDEWQEGLASSIRWGINELQKISPSTDAAILMMCDQPFVSSELLDELINKHEKTGKPIVTCSFDYTTGPPALFHQSLFPELLQLTGDRGAKKVVEIHVGNTVTIPFSMGNIDVDTMDDYEALKK